MSPHLRGLRAVRQRQNISQRQLAIKAGLDATIVNKLEHLALVGYPKWTAKLAGALGCQASELL